VRLGKGQLFVDHTYGQIEIVERAAIRRASAK
jgi:hypothetical protein